MFNYAELPSVSKALARQLQQRPGTGSPIPQLRNVNCTACVKPLRLSGTLQCWSSIVFINVELRSFAVIIASTLTAFRLLTALLGIPTLSNYLLHGWQFNSGESFWNIAESSTLSSVYNCAEGSTLSKCLLDDAQSSTLRIVSSIAEGSTTPNCPRLCAKLNPVKVFDNRSQLESFRAVTDSQVRDATISRSCLSPLLCKWSPCQVTSFASHLIPGCKSQLLFP